MAAGKDERQAILDAMARQSPTGWDRPSFDQDLLGAMERAKLQRGVATG